MAKLDILFDRVSTLEKLVVELSKWVKFDLDKFERRFTKNTDDDDDENDKKLKPLLSTLPLRTHQHQTRSSSTKGKRNVAHKSTGGYRGKIRKAPITGKLFKSNTAEAAFTPCEVDVDVKVEPSFDCESENEFVVQSVPPYTFSGDERKNDNDDADDNYAHYDIADNSDSEDYNSSSSDQFIGKNRFDASNFRTSRRTKKSQSVTKTKPLATNSGIKRARRYTPLDVPPTEATKDLNPVIKLDKINGPDLEKIGVIIPEPRKRKPRGPYPCPQCGKVIITKRELFAHEKEHPKTKKGPLQCPFCPRLFRHNSRLVQHERCHTGEKPYLCPYCGHTSRTKQMLESHLSLLHPETPRVPSHKCDQCDKIFLSQAGLCKHIKKEHGKDGKSELAVQCHLCTAVVSDAYKLKRHIQDIHLDRRTLSCHLCGQLFKRPQHLRKHISRHDNPNRRKRGPQRPMLKGGAVLLPQPEENEEASTPPPLEKKDIVDPATSDNYHEDGDNLITGDVQPPEEYATIGQTAVSKEFSIDYLQ